jgi:hypothetical protein
MDSVGNVVDGVAGEHLAGDVLMPSGDAVDVAAEIQGQQGMRNSPSWEKLTMSGDGSERSPVKLMQCNDL